MQPRLITKCSWITSGQGSCLRLRRHGRTDPARWNTFLAAFGLQFNINLNGIGGAIPVSSTILFLTELPHFIITMEIQFIDYPHPIHRQILFTHLDRTGFWASTQIRPKMSLYMGRLRMMAFRLAEPSPLPGPS